MSADGIFKRPVARARPSLFPTVVNDYLMGVCLSSRPCVPIVTSLAIANVIFDTGAAAASNVCKDEGFDDRTKASTDAVINGIGDGEVTAPFEGTVYAKVTANVYQVNGEVVERKVVIRFDAVYAPKLLKGGTGLLSHAELSMTVA